jgi:hypothetical protein
MILFNISKKTPNKTKNENKTIMISDDRENKKIEQEDDEPIMALLKQNKKEIYFSLARWW